MNCQSIYRLLRRVIRHLRWRAEQVFLPVKIELYFWLKIICAGSPKAIRSLNQFYKHPIIIGGCGRSGTTLLLSVLSCHPMIFAIGDETGSLCPSSNQKQVHAKFMLRKDIIIRHLASMSNKDNCIWWAEKTPRNVLSYRRLIKHFGKNSRVINVVRDGRDVITSIHPSKPDEYYIPIQRWIEHVKAGRDMENNIHVMTIKYEELILKHEQTIRQVCTFIGVEYSERFDDYPDSARIIGTSETNAWFNDRTPINPKSIGRWKSDHYKQRVDELMSQKEAVELMRFYGYIK